MMQYEQRFVAIEQRVKALGEMRIEGYNRTSSNSGIAFARGTSEDGRQYSRVHRLVVVNPDDYPDTILCREPWTDMPDGSDESVFGTIHVMKPYLLRRTPFDGPEGRRRAGKRFEYETNTKRKSIEVTDETSTETQLVTPDYVAGDEIYAIKYIANNVDNGSEQRFSWLDSNVDGREWAVEE